MVKADSIVSINWPKADIVRLSEHIQRASKELNKSLKSSVAWAGVLLCQSLGASTRVAPKLRKIVKNPNSAWQDDKRRAPFGVMKYDKTGKEVFVPIYRSGEFGKIRFIDKKTAQWLVRDRNTGEVHRENWETGTGEFQMAGIAQSRKRIIRRSGLAKKSWLWSQRGLNANNRTSMAIDGIPDVAEVRWGGSKANPALTIANNLRYIVTALKGGRQSFDSVCQRTANNLSRRIDLQIQKVKKGFRL